MKSKVGRSMRLLYRKTSLLNSSSSSSFEAMATKRRFFFLPTVGRHVALDARSQVNTSQNFEGQREGVEHMSLDGCVRS